MHTPPRGQRGLWLAVAGGLAASLIAAVAWIGWGSQRLEIWYWSGRLSDMPAEDPGPPVRALARLGTPGLRIVIPSLDAPDRPKAAAVEQALVEHVQSIEQYSPPRAMTERLTLASALCDAMPQQRASGRRRIVRLAVRLLANAGQDASAQRTELTIFCQRILQWAREAPPEQSNLAAVSSTDAESDAGDQSSAQPVEQPAEALAAASLSVEVTDESGAVGQTSPDKSAPTEPRSLEPLPQEPPPTPLPQPPAAPIAEFRPVRSVANLPIETRPVPSNVHPSGTATPAPTDAAEPVLEPIPMARLTTLEVIRELRSEEPGRAATAERTLKGRGMSPLELELSRRLCDPEVAARERLAFALPSLPGVDARTWLAWLAADGHSQVRRAAYSVMATIPDAELFQQITKAAQQDADPSIRLLANELLRKRRQNAASSGL